MRVTILASSSAANATLLEADGDTLLVDAGLRWSDLAAAIGPRAATLTAAAITHEHADHARAAGHLARHGIDVIASPGTHERLALPAHRAVATDQDHPARAGRWLVRSFPVAHDAEQPLGFLIAHDADPARVLYITDAGRIPARFRGVTHALIEANYDDATITQAVADGRTDRQLATRIRQNHLSIAQAEHLLRQARAASPRYTETHLLHLSDAHADAAWFARRARAATGRPVYIAGHQGNHQAEPAQGGPA